MSFDEVLDSFKKSETSESVVALVNDVELQNGLVAWKSVILKQNPVICNLPSDSPSQWEWLWSHISFDVSDFGIVAGVRMQDSERLFRRLKGLRLIYPDGSVNVKASQYVQAVIMSKIKSLVPKK